LAGGKWGDAIPDADPERLLFDPVTHRLMGSSVLVGDIERYTFYEPNDQKVWNALVAAYPGARVTLASVSDNHRKWVLRVDSPTEGPAYALVDLATKKGSWIGDVYAGLKAADISPVRPIAFTAKDGLALTGYLTLPYGKPDKALPLVVLPHGGPATRDVAGFDWWAQALASRGYAVLQVNYRGSDGLGWALQSAGFGQWGRKMQTDLSDGVRYLAKMGTIDPARVCIVGGSYGGYAALAGATLDPGVYRCAVSVAGVSDVARLVDWDATREGRQGVASQRYWVRYMGATSTMGEISPARHADAATAPILLIHGKDDTVVPYAQSEEMASALLAAGKPAEFVTLKGEDHWLSEGETRLQMLTATVAFLEKNNPPN
jgi:dipeptidyl aminopeptidase/acylaminoacyl peptidase